jgi:hypothetical protein
MGATSTNFFQHVIFSSYKVAKIGKNWQKCFTVFVLIECLGCVSRPEKRENSHKKFENLSILANFDQFYKLRVLTGKNIFTFFTLEQF